MLQQLIEWQRRKPVPPIYCSSKKDAIIISEWCKNDTLDLVITEMYFSIIRCLQKHNIMERRKRKKNLGRLTKMKLHVNSTFQPSKTHITQFLLHFVPRSCLSLFSVVKCFFQFLCSMFLLIIYCSFSWYKHNTSCILWCGVFVHMHEVEIIH